MGFTKITVQDTILSSHGGFHSRVKTGSVELSGMESTMRLFVCNVELTTVKCDVPTITKSAISQLENCNFTLPIRHLDWTHNLVLIKQVKDIRARYWYMVQSITNHWTTRYLQEAIKLDDYGKHGALERQGKNKRA